jgi:hypothetical protein
LGLDQGVNAGLESGPAPAAGLTLEALKALVVGFGLAEFAVEDFDAEDFDAEDFDPEDFDPEDFDAAALDLAALVSDFAWEPTSDLPSAASGSGVRKVLLASQNACHRRSTSAGS